MKVVRFFTRESHAVQRLVDRQAFFFPFKKDATKLIVASFFLFLQHHTKDPINRINEPK